MRNHMNVLYSDFGGALREVAGDVIMDPAVGGLDGGIQAAKHGIWNAHSDVDVGTGQGLECFRVGFKELYLGDAIGLENLHDLVRR